MITVSIIMAVYNAEKYLSAAIESVRNQTRKDWELICINDGSTDTSWQILQKYADMDSRIRILSQDNSGPMAARKRGIERSVGKYILYLDADDFLSHDLLDEAYDTACKTGADAVAPDLMYGANSSVPRDYRSWNRIRNIDTARELSGKEAFLETFPWNRIHGVLLWNGNMVRTFIHTSYIQENDFNADEYLQRVFLLNCHKVVYSRGAYYYRSNPESITQKLSMRQFQRLGCNRKLIDLAHAYGLDEQGLRKVEAFTFLNLIKLQMMLFIQRKNLSRQERLAGRQMIREAYASYASPRHLPLGHPIKKALIANGYPLFYCTVRILSLLKR